MRSPLRVFFVAAFALTWGIGAIALLIGRWMPESRPLSTSSPLYYLAAYSVSLTGIALTAKYDGQVGLRRLAGRLAPRPSTVLPCLIVILGYAAVTALALRLAAFVDSAEIAIPEWRRFLLLPVFALVSDPGPLGEEFGWRGFALPRMLERYSPFPASVRLGVIHAAWHIPLFFIPGMPQTQVSMALFALGVISIAIFDTALYLRTQGNLLLPILVHLMSNVCGGIALSAHALSFFFVGEGLAAAGVVIAGGLKLTAQLPEVRRGLLTRRR